MSEAMVLGSTREHPRRTPEAVVDPRFVARWSPRAFDPAPIPDEVLRSLFEAARWAPSSYNDQPWHFHVATRGEARDRLDEAILPMNRTWSDQAPVLVFVTARRVFAHNGRENRHAWFDTGAATLQLVLQAQEHGLVAHAMGGIDPGLAHRRLGLGADEEVVCALAIGRPGDPDALPSALREREAPSLRKPLREVYTELA